MSQIYGKIFKKGPLSQTHLEIIKLVGNSKEVLELGSSTGYVTKELSKDHCTVDIIEIDKEDAEESRKFAREAFVGSLDSEQFLKRIKHKYDIVVIADVLEHLKDPAKVLTTLKNNLKQNGFILLSLPNIACWNIRRDLFFKGLFDYRDSGILDRTHLRFFTYYTAQDLVINSGFVIKDIQSVEISYPFKNLVLKFRRPGRMADRFIDGLLVRLFPNFATTHLLIKAMVND